MTLGSCLGRFVGSFQVDTAGTASGAEGTACAKAGSMESAASLAVAVAWGAWVFLAAAEYQTPHVSSAEVMRGIGEKVGEEGGSTALLQARGQMAAP